MIVLDQPTKGKITSTRTIALKLGQKDSVKVPALELEFDAPNYLLDQVYPGLRELMFSDKPSTAPASVKARQQRLEVVDPVSDRVSLTEAGQKLGWVHWDGEQSGCTFVLIRGTARANSNITLEGMTLKKLRLKAQEGGTVRVRVAILSTRSEELDDATHGRVMKLQKGAVEFTLEGPQVDTSQRDMEEEEDPLGGPPPVVNNKPPETPEQALARALQEEEDKKKTGDGTGTVTTLKKKAA